MKEEITIDLPEDVYKAIQKLSLESGESFDSLVEQALKVYLNAAYPTSQG